MVDEDARHDLYRGLEELLGTRRADTLVSLLPPVGFTTKDDLERFEARLELRMSARFDQQDAALAALETTVDRRIAHLEADLTARMARAEARTDARFAQVDARFERVEARLARLEERLDRVEARLDRALIEQARLYRVAVGAMVVAAVAFCVATVPLVLAI